MSEEHGWDIKINDAGTAPWEMTIESHQEARARHEQAAAAQREAVSSYLNAREGYGGGQKLSVPDGKFERAHYRIQPRVTSQRTRLSYTGRSRRYQGSTVRHMQSTFIPSYTHGRESGQGNGSDYMKGWLVRWLDRIFGG
jgi:hypothetical protein